jgi:hypothetical protein
MASGIGVDSVSEILNTADGFGDVDGVTTREFGASPLSISKTLGIGEGARFSGLEVDRGGVTIDTMNRNPRIYLNALRTIGQ